MDFYKTILRLWFIIPTFNHNDCHRDSFLCVFPLDPIIQPRRIPSCNEQSRLVVTTQLGLVLKGLWTKAYSKDNDSRPKWAMSLPFLIDIIRSFSNLTLPPHQMAKRAEEFLRLLDNTQEYGHGFDVELPGLNVMNDAFAIIGK